MPLLARCVLRYAFIFVLTHTHPSRSLSRAQSLRAEASGELHARVKASMAKTLDGDDDAFDDAAPGSHGRSASEPARRSRSRARASTGSFGLAMLSGAARVSVKAGSRAAALLAVAAVPEKPQPKWSSRW
jgi:hypothetical protein